MQLAVSPEADADTRRIAVTRVAESRQHDEPWAVAGFKAIALLDHDAQTRSVAIRALEDSRDPGVADTLLTILNYQRAAEHEVYPPGEMTRWDATEVLVRRLAAGRVKSEQMTAVRDTLARLLASDPSQHVRVRAAEGLRCFVDDRAAVRALIDGVDDEVFAVAQMCEAALVSLTGVTHDRNQQAWNAWYAANTNDLFAGAGQTPPGWGSPYRGKLHKNWVNTKRFFRGQ